ncbi:threonine/serine exporter family protein, partial [Blautia hominis]|nr:threonine/serine exporter family protein [Blautia hominis]
MRKCPVTLFLIAGIFPLVPGIGIYTITQAMDKFLPGLYEETAVAGRY